MTFMLVTISVKQPFVYKIMLLISFQLVGTRGFAALSRPGPPVVFIPFARCFAGFPLQHAWSGPPVVFILVARYFVTLSPGPHTPFTPMVHRSPATSPASPSPTPHAEPGRAGPRGNTKAGAAHFGTLFLSAMSIGRNPKPSSQTDPRHRQTDSAAHFGTSFLSVSFIGLSSGGL